MILTKKYHLLNNIFSVFHKLHENFNNINHRI